MNRIGQLLTAARFTLLGFRRNPAATFFTIVFPMIFMLLFGFIFGSQIMDNGAKVVTFQVPGILALSLVSATFVNLAMTTVFRRELGQLKRIRSTPMPPLIYILAEVLAAVVIVIFMTVLMIAVGRIIFDVTFNIETLPVFLVTLVIATATFCALGLAVTALIPSQQAAPAVVNGIVLPLYFISDVFLDTADVPAAIGLLGDIFPVKHLARSLQDSFNPFVTTVEIPWGHWLVMAAWGVFGIIAAIATFRWTPRRSN